MKINTKKFSLCICFAVKFSNKTYRKAVVRNLFNYFQIKLISFYIESEFIRILLLPEALCDFEQIVRIFGLEVIKFFLDYDFCELLILSNPLIFNSTKLLIINYLMHGKKNLFLG